MKLYFSNESYRKIALQTKTFKKSNHTASEAFMLLIKGVSKEDLSNLISMMENKYGISEEDSYSLTQGKSTSGITVDNDFKSDLLDLAYKCIESGKNLGEKTVLNGKMNTSGWMGHVLYEGKLSKELAIKLGLDGENAQIQGILHDYGRKVTHSLEHVTRGYEKLIDEGWENEATCCLTHSFLNGGRCASNDSAEEGFYVDENGNPCWKAGAEKDDITQFLEGYKYSEYDDILNIADLMATSFAIVSPYDRIQDIATRRTLDPTNRGYFLAEFTNKLVDFMRKTGAEISEDMPNDIKATTDVSLDELNETFKNVSDKFWKFYKENISLDKKIPLTQILNVATQETTTHVTDTEKTIINLASREIDSTHEK